MARYTDEEIEKRKAKLRTLHDSIKESPYWLSFDERLAYDLLGEMHNLGEYCWGIAGNENPYYVMIRCITHDFNAMISNLRWCLKHHEKSENEHSNVIVVLQTFLTLVHGLLDGRRDEDDVVGYTCTSNNFKTFKSLYDPALHEYYAVNVIREKNVPALLKWLDCQYEKRPDSHLGKWCKDAAEEMRSGKQIVGRQWLIKDRTEDGTDKGTNQEPDSRKTR